MDLLMKLIILPLLAAFSHWSYVITENYLIVVDLQGVDRENKYILTDPSIHSQDPQFGNTNLGKAGIEQFFKSHKYSEICAAMNLPKNKRHIRYQVTNEINWKTFFQIQQMNKFELNELKKFTQCQNFELKVSECTEQ